ncbi:B-box type zinc finger family protein isoform X2 [Carex rostrata]
MGDGKVREGSRKCALCEGEARMYCKSDDAMLCWDCDASVHGANFLVARHTRALLCRSCRNPTTWKASGSRLTPTISLCSHCCFGGDNHGGLFEGESQSLEDEEEDEEIEHENKEEEEGEEEGDNQVVPRGMPVAATIDPPVASSSSNDGSTQKRVRNDPNEQSSSSEKDDEAEATSMPIQQMECDRINRIVGGVLDKGVSKTRRHFRLRRERKRSTALSHTSVSAAGSRQKPTFLPTAVAGEQSMLCSSARRSISPPKQ